MEGGCGGGRGCCRGAECIVRRGRRGREGEGRAARLMQKSERVPFPVFLGKWGLVLYSFPPVQLPLPQHAATPATPPLHPSHPTPVAPSPPRPTGHPSPSPHPVHMSVHAYERSNMYVTSHARHAMRMGWSEASLSPGERAHPPHPPHLTEGVGGRREGVGGGGGGGRVRK